MELLVELVKHVHNQLKLEEFQGIEDKLIVIGAVNSAFFYRLVPATLETSSDGRVKQCAKPNKGNDTSCTETYVCNE